MDTTRDQSVHVRQFSTRCHLVPTLCFSRFLQPLFFSGKSVYSSDLPLKNDGCKNCVFPRFLQLSFFSGKSRWIDRVVQFTVTDRILMIRSEMLSTPSETCLSRKSFPQWDRNAGAYDNSKRNIILDHLSLYEAWCNSVSNPCSLRLAPCLRKGHKNFFENTRGALITRAKVDPQNPILLW